LLQNNTVAKSAYIGVEFNFHLKRGKTKVKREENKTSVKGETTLIINLYTWNHAALAESSWSAHGLRNKNDQRYI
jgi:hypothetical protein